MKEQDLAAKVVSWLEAQSWNVYQEVECHNHVCDIIALRGSVLAAIECKTTLNLAVIGQAHRWRRYAQFSYVAVPTPKRRRDYFVERVIKDYGIGLIHVDAYRDSVHYAINAAFNRRCVKELKQSLCPEQKTWAKAGNAEGKRFTPFQRTKRTIQQIVRGNGSIPLKQLIDQIDHHYCSDHSARHSLKDLIERGIIEGVSIRKDGKSLIVEHDGGGD